MTVQVAQSHMNRCAARGLAVRRSQLLGRSAMLASGLYDEIAQIEQLLPPNMGERCPRNGAPKRETEPKPRPRPCVRVSRVRVACSQPRRTCKAFMDDE